MEGRLASVRTNNETTTFFYDADGQRILTDRPGDTFVYTPFPDFEREVAGSVVTERTTYTLAGQLIGVRVKVNSGSNEVYYTYTDHLGSVAAMSWAGGTFRDGSLARYDPFGNYRTWPGSNVNPLIFDRGFTGHVHDNTGPYPTQNVGLIYMNARYYLPEVGRFVSADTIVPDPANPQSHNRYSYVRNDPLNLKDPTGHRETDGCEVSSCGLGGSSSNYLWQTADGQLMPWDPTQTEPRYEAALYGASSTVRARAFGPIGFSMAIGVEVLVNHESGEVTSFLYYSGNANAKSVGASGNAAVYVGGVNNLNGSNYNYRGVSRTASASAAAGPLGLTTGYTYNLNDNPFDPKGVWSEYVGWAPGMGASVGVSDANYIPIFTNNLETGESSWEIIKYAQEHWQMTVDDFTGAWNTLQEWFR